jgi:cell fate regulator YaaT (PSP1 superfamily)
MVGGLGVCRWLMCCLAFEDESLGRLYAEEEMWKRINIVFSA